MSSNSEFLHFKLLINRFWNFFSSPILSFKRLVLELTLSRIFTSINFPSTFSTFYNANRGKIETIVKQNTSKRLLKPNFPIEYRYYPKGSSGMKTHSDTILFNPPQYEVVYTIQNSSDSYTGWYSKDNKLTRIHTEPNSAIIIKAGSNRHYVSPVKEGDRSILKLIYSEIRIPIKKYS